MNSCNPSSLFKQVTLHPQKKKKNVKKEKKKPKHILPLEQRSKVKRNYSVKSESYCSLIRSIYLVHDIEISSRNYSQTLNKQCRHLLLMNLCKRHSTIKDLNKKCLNSHTSCY